MSLIIEFEGIAGCGKTTLCAALREKLSSRNVPVIHLNERPLRSYFGGKTGEWSARLKTASPRALGHALRFLLASGCFSGARHVRLLYDLEAVCRHFQRHAAPEAVMVCDQSLLQTVVSVWGYDDRHTLTPRESRAVRHFLQTAPEAAHFLCVLPLEEHVARIRKRGRKKARLESIERDDVLLEKLKNNEYTLSQVVSLREQVGPEPRLDMRKEPETLADEVLACCRK